MLKYFFIAVLLLIVVSAIYYFFPEGRLPKGAVVDKLVVYKSQCRMEAWQGSTLLKTYTVSFGGNPVGHKEFEGDRKTPEGSYTINERNPNSGYHKNLGISYPNAGDVAHAKALGKSPGGLIKIHGLRNGRGYIGKFHRWKNWTAGCIAVTNAEIDELYVAVKPNAVIQINP